MCPSVGSKFFTGRHPSSSQAPSFLAPEHKACTESPAAALLSPGAGQGSALRRQGWLGQRPPPCSRPLRHRQRQEAAAGHPATALVPPAPPCRHWAAAAAALRRLRRRPMWTAPSCAHAAACKQRQVVHSNSDEAASRLGCNICSFASGCMFRRMASCRAIRIGARNAIVTIGRTL